MKKFLAILLLTGGVSALTTAMAQSLPNGDFEEWKGSCGYSYQTNNPVGNRQRPGDEPKDWNGSSVNQAVKFFGTQTKTATLVSKSEHDNNGSAVKLENQFVGVELLGIGSNAPAFINFGTPWVYASTTISDCDGGVYGSVDFSNKPDAIRGTFKRSGGTGEKAHIIAYLWNGTFTSTVAGSVTLDDVDRVVMGRSTGTGDGQLIASCDYEFSTTENDDWEVIEVPLTYVEGQENAEPTKMNVILSSADYWTRGNIKEGSILEVDDVDFVYYNTLSSLTYDGTELLSGDQTSYDLSTVEYDASKLSYTLKGVAATKTTSYNYNEETAVLTITVKGNNYDATDNSTFTVYTIQFGQPTETTYTNYLGVSVNGITTEPQSTEVQLIQEVDGTTSFALNNFILVSGENSIPVGNIKLTNVTVSGNSYSFNNTITIAAGDDSQYSSDDWYGPRLGNVPVVLSATVDNDGMTALIDIDMTSSLGQVIRVVFAPAVTISSGADVNVEAGLKNVTFNRNFSAGWNTICLPFDYSLSAFGYTEAGDYIATAAQEFSAADENGLDFSSVSTLEANKPYLVYFSVALTSTPIYFGVKVQEPTPSAVTYGDYTFQGNYTAGFSMSGKYGVANIDGKQYIRLGGSNSKLNATGAYFTSSSTSLAQSMVLNLSGEITGIGSVSTETVSNTNGAVYNLQGIRVSEGSLDNLPKGIYMQNGKKIYVK